MPEVLSDGALFVGTYDLSLGWESNRENFRPRESVFSIMITEGNMYCSCALEVLVARICTGTAEFDRSHFLFSLLASPILRLSS